MPPYGTFGSLTFRLRGRKLASEISSPVAGMSGCYSGGDFMKIIHVCYAAFGFAVARWLFKREPMFIADPVSRLRASGLL